MHFLETACGLRKTLSCTHTSGYHVTTASPLTLSTDTGYVRALCRPTAHYSLQEPPAASILFSASPSHSLASTSLDETVARVPPLSQPPHHHVSKFRDWGGWWVGIQPRHCVPASTSLKTGGTWNIPRRGINSRVKEWTCFNWNQLR